MTPGAYLKILDVTFETCGPNRKDASPLLQSMQGLLENKNTNMSLNCPIKPVSSTLLFDFN